MPHTSGAGPVRHVRGIGRWIARVMPRFAIGLEDRWQARRLRRLAQSPHHSVSALPFPAFGTDDWARVRGRVVLTAAALERRPTPTIWAAARANLRQFSTTEVPHARVRIEVGSRTVVTVADREGYFDVMVSGIELRPGRLPCAVTPIEPPGPSAVGTVHVPDPDTDLVIVTDIDDTIVDSGVAHGLFAVLRTALLRDSATRVPLDGAAELAVALARGGDGEHERPFVYLSTSPWNLVEFLIGFLQRHGFPVGPLVLTDWGPSEHGLFRISTTRHKATTLRLLAETMPRARFVLIGDSGQKDPEIYASFALEQPDRVAAIFIRKAGRDRAGEKERLSRWTRTLGEHGVATLVADDGFEMLAEAARIGLTRSPQ